MPLVPICCICCDYFTPDCTIKATKCGHIFHGPCIQRWLKNTPSCPECRKFGPDLFRVYHHFYATDEDVADGEAKNCDLQQKQIENLIRKLSLEETKNKQADQRLLEVQKKLQDELRAAKLKDEEHLKELKALREKMNREALENMKRTRQATGDAEKLLRMEMSELKLKSSTQPVEKPKTASRITRCCSKKLTVIKVVTPHRPNGHRVRSTSTSTSTATSTSISTSTATSTSKMTSLCSHSSCAMGTRNAATLVKPSFSRNMSRTQTTATANVTSSSHHFDYLSNKLF